MKSLWLFGLGLLIGAWGSLCGIGGGVFAVPMFHFLCGMTLPAAIANSLVLVALMTSGGTLAELAQPGCALHWDVVGVLLATSWIGTQLGYRAAKKIAVRRLKLAFGVLLVGVALEILASSHERSALAGGDFEWSPGLIALLAGTGFVSGFVSPLLGIGGGLIAVPALLFGLPAIGYLGARACSTAMSAFNAWLSVWLYRKRGGLRFELTLPASAGALCGSWAGVRLAHVPGITFYAEIVIALTLLLISARFVWDLRAKSYAGTP
ncbi:MAG: sulfite exporter TauE/SafE family protein [Planctomycetes bacterium]|nr:sulfite exporter TauE/SafE family protein [Planctomycetota bacterium]